MSLCNICSQQHHHEQQKLRRVLLWGLLGSVGVHAVGFSLSHLPRWQTVTEDLSPIELIVTEALPIEPEVAPNPEPPAELSSQTNDPAPAAASAPPRPAAIVAPPRPALSPVKAAMPYTPEPDPPAASAWETPAVAEAETPENAEAVTEAVTPETEVDTSEDEAFELDTDTPEAETSEDAEAVTEAVTPEVDTSAAVEADTSATEADTLEVIEAGATATGEDEAPSDRLTALLQRLRTSQSGAGPSPAVVPTESATAGGGNVPNAPLGNEPGVATAPSTNHSNGQGQSARTVACQNCVRPNYPQNALSAGAEGQPVVSVDINPDGSVGRVRLTRSSGNAAIDQAAIEAAQQSRFQPVAGGASVPIEYDLTIEGSRRNRAARRQGERQSVEVPTAPNSATAATETPPPAAPSPSESSDSAREVAPAAAPQTTPATTAESSTPETTSMPEADSSAPDPDPPSQGNPVEADPTAPALEPALPSSSPPSSFPPATGSSPAAPAVPTPVPAPAVAPPSPPPPIAPPPSVAPVAPAAPAAAPATREE